VCEPALRVARLNFQNQLFKKEKNMARPKRTSPVLQTAHKRLSGLNSIVPPPDFGTNLTLAAYNTQINNFTSKLDNYNQMVATLDMLQNEMDALESALNETNKRMLAATQAHYGPDSNEYEQAGGKRLSERKRSSKKAPDNPQR
jgi:hypothetical protein